MKDARIEGSLTKSLIFICVCALSALRAYMHGESDGRTGARRYRQRSQCEPLGGLASFANQSWPFEGYAYTLHVLALIYIARDGKKTVYVSRILLTLT